MKHPELGKNVEHLDFEGAKNDQLRNASATLWAPGGTAGLTKDDMQLAIQYLQHFQLEPLESFTNALAQGSIDAYVCLTLAFLHELRSLALGSHFVTFNSTFLGCLFRQALQLPQTSTPSGSTIGPLPQYASLRKVQLGRIASDGTPSSVQSHFQDLYAFFYLPSLEDLAIELPRAKGFTWPDPLKRAPMMNLTSLTLPYCEANESALEGLLSSKPPLRNLVYNYYCAEDVSYSKGYYFNLDTVSLALSHVKSTLQSLTIFFEHQAPDADDYPCYANGLFVGTLAPFSCFPHLEYLEIAFVMLIGWEVVPHDVRPLAEMLPQSLRHLCLTDNLADWVSCDWEPKHVLERLCDLLAANKESKSQIARSLEAVEIRRRSVTFEWEEEEEIEFDKLSEQYGMQIFLS